MACQPVGRPRLSAATSAPPAAVFAAFFAARFSAFLAALTLSCQLPAKGCGSEDVRVEDGPMSTQEHGHKKLPSVRCTHCHSHVQHGAPHRQATTTALFSF
jgi:hypothetical protein